MLCFFFFSEKLNFLKILHKEKIYFYSLRIKNDIMKTYRRGKWINFGTSFKFGTFIPAVPSNFYDNIMWVCVFGWGNTYKK